jgi:NAD(P)-dependent dehydrogenase (short-subunit alcohol dehydrogenase family)
MVSLAEARLASASSRAFVSAGIEGDVAAPAGFMPILRGLVAGNAGSMKRLILDHRNSDAAMAFVDGDEVARYGQAGPVTPDHVIRTKPWPMIIPTPRPGALDEFRAGVALALKEYERAYDAYFERHNARQTTPKTELDPIPRVILAPGVGLFGLGASAKAASIAADLAETTARVVAQSEKLGRFESIPEADVFDVEYWSLEQAKLGRGVEKPLARQVVAVTGGASGIGLATVRAFLAQGAEVLILDRDAVADFGCASLQCDVTDVDSVNRAFDRIVEMFGGVDVVVSNAGAAWSGRIGDVSEEILRESFELNFYGHQRVAQAAVRIMRAQGTGGALLFNTSKQALNPGPDFGPYGLPKAATLFLMRQYALDHGADGIRSNAVNADRIRTGLLNDYMITERSAARGLSEADYMSGNLLGREVTADDVAQAFVDLALAEKTTGAILTVDGGNIAASVR